MTYYFDFITGKIVNKSESTKSNIIDNKNGWTPYYNLAGKYVGFKSEKKQINKHLKYYNPKLKSWVETYEELNWQNKKISIDEILCIDIERAETIVKNTLKLLKIQPNIFRVIEFIRMSPDYATCDEKMLAVYTATIGKVIDACKEEK